MTFMVKMILTLSLIANLVLLILFLHSRKSYHLLMKKNLQTEKSEDVLVEQVSYDAVEYESDKEHQLLQKLKELMEQQHLYLDAEMNIQKMAKVAGTNKNNLSHVINKCLKQNFASFLNRYRVREAIRLLEDPRYRSYKIEAIGEMCGFGNRQAFHSAFKKEMGITPTHFRNISKKTDQPLS